MPRRTRRLRVPTPTGLPNSTCYRFSSSASSSGSVASIVGRFIECRISSIFSWVIDIPRNEPPPNAMQRNTLRNMLRNDIGPPAAASRHSFNPSRDANFLWTYFRELSNRRRTWREDWKSRESPGETGFANGGNEKSGNCSKEKPHRNQKNKQ